MKHTRFAISETSFGAVGRECPKPCNAEAAPKFVPILPLARQSGSADEGASRELTPQGSGLIMDFPNLVRHFSIQFISPN